MHRIVVPARSMLGLRTPAKEESEIPLIRCRQQEPLARVQTRKPRLDVAASRQEQPEVAAELTLRSAICQLGSEADGLFERDLHADS